MALALVSITSSAILQVKKLNSEPRNLLSKMMHLDTSDAFFSVVFLIYLTILFGHALLSKGGPVQLGSKFYLLLRLK